MNHIHFDPNGLSGDHQVWWMRWQEKSESAALDAIEQAERGEKVQFSVQIWSELKSWLLKNVFNGKCAYCESKVTITDYGDADHYRPKGSVGGEPGHNGYYWAAYDWRNLVPSCKQCNTGGKSDLFPVAGRRIFQQKDAATCALLDAIEKPLLLHPYGTGDNHPRQHLVFDKFGHVKARNSSQKGFCSIEVYNLKRNDLKEERKEQIENALMRFQAKLSASPTERNKFLKNCTEGKIRYSAAITDSLLDELDRKRQEMDIVTASLQMKP